jgi:hypothetical protein
MLVLILVAVWIAILTPIAIKRLRDRDTDQSIASFHEHMARLGDRGQPIVEPAHRLEPSPQIAVAATAVAPRASAEPQISAYAPPVARPVPHLRVVPEGATQAQLDRDLSWDEWSRQYLDEPLVASREVSHVQAVPAAAVATPPEVRRPSAYANVPTAARVERAPSAARAQRVRRRKVLFAISGTAIVASLLAIVAGGLFFDAIAVLGWLALIGYLGLMYYAMTVGMIDGAAKSSRTTPVRLVNPRSQDSVDDVNVWDNEYYEASPSAQFTFTADDEPYAQAL